MLILGYNLVDYRRSIRNLHKMEDEDGCQLWRECVRWLLDTGVLRKDHKCAQPDAAVLDLALTLRDGVLLCLVMNELIPNSIDANQIPTQVNQLSEYQSQKIICMFLGACQKSLNMAETDLFLAWELSQMQDLKKVLNTLSMISHSEPAIRRGIRPFPVGGPRSNSRALSSCIQPAPEEEDIYRNLQDDVENAELDAAAIYGVTPYQNLYDEDTKIYDHIVARQDSKRELKTDAWSTFQPSCKREHCIKELLDTEQNYVEKALNMIMNRFHAPLKAVLTSQDHDKIFMNINQLWNLHHAFYNDLRQSVFRTLNLNQSTEGRPTSIGKHIGDVFILHKDKFVAYGHYCMSLDESRARIMELEKNDSIVRSKIVECTASANDNQFKLQDLLCLPMQRVLKYHILLSEMIKSTTIDCPDRRSLEQAKEAMEDVNAYVNEMKRDFETQQLIRDVERNIIDLAMPPKVSLLDYGRLHVDGEVRLSETTEVSTGKTKQRHVFVFDKVLIICQAKRNNSKYDYKGAYILHELTAEFDPPNDGNKFGTISKKLGVSGQHSIYLIRDSPDVRFCPGSAAATTVKYLTLTFKTRNQLDKWHTCFNAARDRVKPRDTQGHHVHYQTFSPTSQTAAKCTVCEKFLKGLMYQGYKCEDCSGIFHKDCIRLRPCPGRRQPSVTPNASFSHAGDISRRKQQFGALSKGDQVITMFRLAPSDPTYLKFEKDDVIEVLQTMQEGLFIGCNVNNRQRTGLVKAENVRRMRTNSMVNLQGLAGISLDGGMNGRIGRKESTVLPRRPPSTAVTPGVPGLPPQPDYMNTEVTEQAWYMGNLERPEAEKKLRVTPNGTFLVRYSNNRGRFAISISYEGDVKHTVIEQSEDGMYYLDEGYVFNSIVELVNYYREHNLCESFNSLNTTLMSPYRECKLYRVLHAFEQPEPKFLKLEKGDVLTLVDTVGEDRGWWKGMLNNNIGFFPLSYVEPVPTDDS